MIFCNSNQVLSSVFQAFTCLKCPCARQVNPYSSSGAAPLCSCEDFAVFIKLVFFLNFVLPSDEREAVQKKTFTKWVNSILSRVQCRISDLYLDLRDGRMLIKLLEVLSGEKLVRSSLVQPYVLCFSPFFINCIIPQPFVVIKHLSTYLLPLFFLSVAKAH